MQLGDRHRVLQRLETRRKQVVTGRKPMAEPQSSQGSSPATLATAAVYHPLLRQQSSTRQLRDAESSVKELNARIDHNEERIQQLTQETNELKEERERQLRLEDEQQSMFAARVEEELRQLPERTKDKPHDPETVKMVQKLMHRLSAKPEELEKLYGVAPECVKEVEVLEQRERAERKKVEDAKEMVQAELTRQFSPLRETVANAKIECGDARILDAPLVQDNGGSGTDTDGGSDMDAYAEGGGAAKAKDISALVFDCGTGETKCLKLSYRNAAVEVEQVAFMKEGVVDYIKRERGEEEFCEFVKQQLEENDGVTTSIIGTSAWSRDPKHKAASSRLAQALRRLAVVPKRLPQDVEGVYEAAAVAYAAERMGVEHLAGTIGSGGGSVQFSKGTQFVGIEIGHREGKQRLAKAANPEEELAKWATETVQPELDKQTAHAEQKLAGKVMAISACYFAAKVDGVDLACADGVVQWHKASVVVAKMKAKLEELKQQVRDDPGCLKAREGDDDKKKKDRGNHAMDLCNLTLQTMLYETFFDGECEICFKRNWELPGGVKFRTTWSAGWFLDYLKKRRISIGEGAAARVLEALAEKEHDTVIFDCGTTETKALSYSFTRQQRGSDPGFVRFDADGEKTAPGALDFLEERRPCDCAKDRRPKSAYIDYNEGDEVGEQLRKEDFVRFVEQVVDRSGARRALIGSSSWHRQDEEGKAEWLMKELMRCGVVCKKLHGKDEALYESAAVAYAASKFGINDVTGVIGSGGGSVQFVKDFRDIFQLEVGWRGGQDKVKRSANPLAELEQWRKSSVAVQLDVHANDVEKLTGKVIAISACFYAAKAVGMGSADAEIEWHKASVVVAKMKAKLEELKQQVRDDPGCLKAREGDDDKKKKDRGNHAMDLCNLTLQTMLYETFFDGECEICFKRNWELPGGVKFRTTWSAGWYLHSLKKQGICWPQSNKALDELESLGKQAVSTVARQHSMSAASHERPGKRCSTPVPLMERQKSLTKQIGMRMLDLKKISRRMLRKAEKAEKEFVPKLRSLVFRAGGKLDEAQKCVMDETRLYQKLIAKLEMLLQQNYTSPSYVPSVDEVCAGVKDCLRCSVIFPKDRYLAGIKELEQHWASPGVISDNKRNTFANFWHDEKGLTTRMGITATLTTQLKSRRSYVWSLDFHTEEGMRVNVGECGESGERKFIESLADPLTSEGEKHKLYHKMKQDWDEVPKPLGVAVFAGCADSDYLKERSIWKLRERQYDCEYERQPSSSDGEEDDEEHGDGSTEEHEDDEVDEVDKRFRLLQHFCSSASLEQLGTCMHTDNFCVFAEKSQTGGGGAGQVTHNRYVGVKEFDMSEGKLANRGIWQAMGIPFKSQEWVKMMMSDGESAIEKEFQRMRTLDDSKDAVVKDGLGSDWARFAYVARERAVKVKQKNGKVRDGGHDGWTLDQFHRHPNAKLCGLTKAHVLALRLYTSNSYWRFNQPLRDRQQPHPFPETTWYIYEGLKLLRDMNEKDWGHNKHDEKVYWRGLADVALPDSRKCEGCELACMSTSHDENEARKFAKGDTCALLLKLKGDGWMNWGVDLSWLSMYPGEKESLFPPLTLLRFEKATGATKDGIEVREVKVQWPSMS